VKLSTVFNRSRISKLLTALLIGGLIPAFVPTPAVATGCAAANTSTVDIYTVLTFTSTATCNWSVPTGVTSIDVFMVGGGGGGGADGGGGGGGGAAISRSAFAVTAGNTLALTVGTGGNGSNWNTGYTGTDGSASTLVRTSPSTTLTANGGTKGGMFPAGAAGAGGTAVNGGFAGGRGGNASGTVNTKGGDGFTGVSNYFSGEKIEYGGGGGGGSYYGANSFTETLGKSGGGNGGASGSGNNQPGNPGRTNSGGGGGGGSANGPQQSGGRGADGVIIIRYATDSANAFPSSLISSLSGRFTPNDLQILDNSRKGWIDSTGTLATSTNITTTSASSMSITTRGTTDGANSTGSSKSVLVAKGGTGDLATLIDLNENYTLFHVTRYVTGGTNGRIMSTSSAGSNWLSGHYAGTFKCAHHNQWLTSSGCSSTNIYRWLLSTDQLRYYRADGVDVTLNPDNSSYLADQSLSSGFGVNNYVGGQRSNWEVADLIVFNKRLSASDIFLMESYLANIYGLTITRPLANSETDTAVNLNGQYFQGYYRNEFTFNDLFTMESWVNPAASCATGHCALFSAEATLVTKIESGIFQYALFGTKSNWEWISTGINIPSNQWTHIALSKVLPGRQTNAVNLYVNGQLVYTRSGSPYRAGTWANDANDVVNPLSTWYYIGARTDGNRFYGQVDEFKYWSVARSQSEIATDMHSNATNTANLQLYYDFNSDSLSNSSNLLNLAVNGGGRTHMLASTTMPYVDVKVTSTSGPYTTVSFPRTYITQNGGWKVPAAASKASVIVVGGGGGGGFGTATNRPAGGGGGGGVTVSLTQAFTPGGTIPIQVGQGGLGGFASDVASVRNGQQSALGPSGLLTALGGGGGGNSGGSGAGGSTVATGGGSGESSYTCTGSPPQPSGSLAPGATVDTGYNGSGGIWGWGGSGGGARGAAANGTCSGNQAGTPGSGYVDPVTSVEYGRGGNAASFSVTNAIAGNTTQNNGWGGIISYNGGNSSGVGYRGSNGIIIIRWITATAPTFTAPVAVDTTTAGTHYTFRVSGSATSPLIRNYQWQFSSNSGSSWTTLQASTSDSFTTSTLETTTSGITNRYRVIVTDSDTAGLSISDSRTSYLVINPAITITVDTSTITRDYGVATVKTFTFANGTGPRVATASPGNQSGITWSNLNSDSATLTLAPTLTAGSYSDTITVTDSVTATTSLRLTITINKARQASLSIGQYNAFPGLSTYPINVYGGSTSGAVTRSLLAPGSAGCSLASSMFLSATSPGTCSVQAVKAGDTNYLSETATATIYWIQWSDAYATRAPSTPTEIVLNHSTAITKYNYETLTVTSYQNSSGVTVTSIAASSVIRIIGDGFSPTAAYTEVTFANRDLDAIDLATGLQVLTDGSGNNYLQLTLPAGITTGAITVNSPKGMAVGPVLTIVP
jgi:hypothetical protein